MSSHRFLCGSLVLITLCSVASPRALGAGFELVQWSARHVAQGTAGSTTGLDDGSSASRNPAAMLTEDGQVLSAGFSIVTPSIHFDNEGSSMSPLLGGMPLAGGDGGDGGGAGVVPSLYFVQPISSSHAWGLGVNAPFGLTTEYDRDWVGRYHALKSELKTINVNPGVCWQANPRVALGAGMSMVNLDAELSSAIDFGTLGFAQVGPGSGLRPQAQDGKVTMTGDDWAPGYNLGLLLSPSTNDFIGLTYRSAVAAELDGTADFDVPTAAQMLTAGGGFVDSDARADLTLPASAAIDYRHELGSAWSLLLGLTWTEWSSMDELRIDFDSVQPDAVTDMGWENTLRYAAGANYHAGERWTFRMGAAYENTPIPDAEHRTPRVPDSDQIWLDLGLSYRISKQVTMDMSYVHAYFDSAPIDHVDATGNRLTGDFQMAADVVGLQVVWTP